MAHANQIEQCSGKAHAKESSYNLSDVTLKSFTSFLNTKSLTQMLLAHSTTTTTITNSTMEATKKASLKSATSSAGAATVTQSCKTTETTEKTAMKQQNSASSSYNYKCSATTAATDVAAANIAAIAYTATAAASTHNALCSTTELLRCNMAKIASNFLTAIISSTAAVAATITTNNISNKNKNKSSSSSSSITDTNTTNNNNSQQKQQFISFNSRRPKRRVAQQQQQPHREPTAYPRSARRQHRSSFESFFAAAIFSLILLMVQKLQIASASSSQLGKSEPMFISRSETFKFVSGDTIVLPCEVANTETYMVAWKRGIAILTAGSVKVTPDPRVRIVNGFNLQIRDAVPQDAGDYICQIATMEPREITHTVEILVPPRIHHISTGGHLQVKKGSSVRIECSASGNPTPNVTWSRKNNILPNGEEKLHSHILSIENVDRHKGGVYICTANNGVGQAASSQVVLHVLYPPEISVERPVVFSGEGHEAMLVCIVHGETQPEVIWFKDTMQLDTTERHIMETRGSRHTLIIRKVHPQDFGNYSCVAENQLGKSRKTLQLSGKPNVAVFSSPPISQYKDRYNISWTVDSHTPIEEYKLSFRRMPQGHEVDNSIDHHSSSAAAASSSLLQMYGGTGSGSYMGNNHNYRMSELNNGGYGGGGGGGGGGSGNLLHWGRNDWRDVVLPAMPLSHHYTQGMSYMIRGLDPDQHYEATVQARNRYGWSDLTHSFVFSTSSNDGLIDLTTFLNHGLSDNEMRDLSVTYYGSASTKMYNRSLHYFGTFIALVLVKLFMHNLG